MQVSHSTCSNNWIWIIKFTLSYLSYNTTAKSQVGYIIRRKQKKKTE